MSRTINFNVLNEDGVIKDSILRSKRDLETRAINKDELVIDLSEITMDSWSCKIERVKKGGMVLFRAEPMMNSKYNKIWFIFKQLTPALRQDPNEYRCQISDLKIKENKRINLLGMDLYNPHKELFLPVGFYNELPLSYGPLVLSIIDPSKIGESAKNRSYYVDLRKISEAWNNGFSLHFDINSYLTICTRKECFPAVIENLVHFYS